MQTKSAVTEECELRELAKRLTGVTRQAAAQIVHEWLLIVKKEADEPDITPAYRLMDLLDCHRCVQHVAQVYIKGIMGDGAPVFGMQTTISAREAETIASRAADPTLRHGVTPGVETTEAPRRMPYEDLKRMREGVHIIDVRDAEEYEEGHLPGAVNIPLARCLDAIESLPAKKDETICFVCAKGVKSRIAAASAMQAGYKNVFYAGEA